ncbi:MAG: hypothetical protein AB8I08_02485 [Sandaracinaceae bacterium]
MGTLSDDTREALLAHLSESIQTHGWESFVAGPVLEPSGRFFPDPYQDGLHGVYQVARRLMLYAGLSDVRIDVVGTAAPQDPLAACTISLVEARRDGPLLPQRQSLVAHRVVHRLRSHAGR